MIPDFLNQNVVVDTETGLTFIGRLTALQDTRSLVLEHVTIYDETTIRISVEEYIIECAENGFAPVRKTVCINRDKVVSMSLLADIIIPGE